MNDGREFLKLFGVGCAVVPIIGGAPVIAAESKLIEVPKLLPVEKSTWAGNFEGPVGDVLMRGAMGVTVTLDTIDGKRITMQGKTFVLSFGSAIKDLRSRDSRFIQAQYLTERTATWKFEGQFIPDENGVIATHRHEFV